MDAKGLVEGVKETKERAVKAVETMHSCCYVNVNVMMKGYNDLIANAEDMYANAENVLMTKATQAMDSEQFQRRSVARLRAKCAAAGLSVTQAYDVYCGRIGHDAETIDLVARMVEEEAFDNAETDDEGDNDEGDNDEGDSPTKRQCP